MAHDPNESTPVPTDANRSEPMAPILGPMRSAREHAVALVEALVEDGYAGKSIYSGDLAHAHGALCKHLGWEPMRWIPVARELGRLGLRKTKAEVGGAMLTYYEVQPIASNVVPIRTRQA